MKNLHTFKLWSVSLFVIFLLSGAIGLGHGINLELFEQTEQRNPAAFPGRPSISVSSLLRFFDSLENWLGDRFLYRQWYMNLYFRLGFTPSTSLKDTAWIKGKNSWLFLGNRHNRVIEKTINFNSVPQNEVEERCALLSRMWRQCQKCDVAFIAVVGPNKHTVYSEYLPDNIQIANPYRFADRVFDVAASQNLPFVFPRKVLEAEKKSLKPEQRLYYMDDSHWNGLGGGIALREAWRVLAKFYPAFTWPQSYPWIFVRTQRKDIGDLIKISHCSDDLKDSQDWCIDFFDRNNILNRAISEKLSDTWYDMKISSPKSLTNKKLLLLGDSYSSAWISTLSCYFRVLYKWQNTAERLSTSGFEDLLFKYHPDVVIYESVERSFTPDPPVVR